MKHIFKIIGAFAVTVILLSAVKPLFGPTGYNVHDFPFWFMDNTDSVVSVRKDSVIFHVPTNLEAGGASQWVTSGDNIYYGTTYTNLVGIGTNSPAELLQVNDGNIAIRNDAQNSFNLGFLIKSGGTTIGGITANVSSGVNTILAGNSHVLVLQANNAERMRIKSNGIINIQNTPEYADDAAAIAGGLVQGDVYRTGSILKIVL